MLQIQTRTLQCISYPTQLSGASVNADGVSIQRASLRASTLCRYFFMTLPISEVTSPAKLTCSHNVCKSEVWFYHLAAKRSDSLLFNLLSDTLQLVEDERNIIGHGMEPEQMFCTTFHTAEPRTCRRRPRVLEVDLCWLNESPMPLPVCIRCLVPPVGVQAMFAYQATLAFKSAGGGAFLVTDPVKVTLACEVFSQVTGSSNVAGYVRSGEA